MSLSPFFTFVVYVGIIVALTTATIISSVRHRKDLMFWLLASISAASMPFAMSMPLPKSGVSHLLSSLLWDGDLLQGEYSRLNLVCFCGAMLSLLLAELPIGKFRILSAISWGFTAAFSIHLIRLIAAG